MHVGKLALFEEHDREFRRRVSYATLRAGPNSAEVIPRLHDAVIRWIGDGFMTVSGFEIDPITRRCSTQSWYVQVVTDDVD